MKNRFSIDSPASASVAAPEGSAAAVKSSASDPENQENSGCLHPHKLLFSSQD